MTEVTTGANCTIAPHAHLGVGGGETSEPTSIGADATVRTGTIIYHDVEIGDGFSTGHNALVRERTVIGDDVLVGTQAVIDGETKIGSNVHLQTGAYVPRQSIIGDDVFLGPYAVLTNDPYPVRKDSELDGIELNEHVSVGANATILPGVEIGEKSFVAAGALVDVDVPPETLAVGTPAKHRPLPAPLQGGNQFQ